MNARAAILACACLLVVGCRPRHVDPVVLTYPTQNLRNLSAEAHAKTVGGKVTLPVQNTHSMEPLILGGDLLVVAPTPFGDKLNGRVLGYRPQWNSALFVVHRAVSLDADGYLMEGDNVPAGHSENKSRVTSANYVGEIVGIYRVRP